ncbi:hypothetical protein JXA32_16520 [Candidatus Sumerlaeota bacterium]|nr:hypothetical protein [Candidatus Sumerlaeota bacterium]
MKPIAYIGMYRDSHGEWEPQRSTLALDETECRRKFIAYHGEDEDDLTPEEVFDRREAAGEVIIALLTASAFEPSVKFHRLMMTVIHYAAITMFQREEQGLNAENAKARLSYTLGQLAGGGFTELGLKHCAICGCIEAAACPGGCGWAQDDPPICTACIEYDDDEANLDAINDYYHSIGARPLPFDLRPRLLGGKRASPGRVEETGAKKISGCISEGK